MPLNITYIFKFIYLTDTIKCDSSTKKLQTGIFTSRLVVIMAVSDGGIFPEKKSGFSCP